MKFAELRHVWKTNQIFHVTVQIVTSTCVSKIFRQGTTYYYYRNEATEKKEQIAKALARQTKLDVYWKHRTKILLLQKGTTGKIPFSRSLFFMFRSKDLLRFVSLVSYITKDQISFRYQITNFTPTRALKLEKQSASLLQRLQRKYFKYFHTTTDCHSEHKTSFINSKKLELVTNTDWLTHNKQYRSLACSYKV